MQLVCSDFKTSANTRTARGQGELAVMKIQEFKGCKLHTVLNINEPRQLFQREKPRPRSAGRNLTERTRQPDSGAIKTQFSRGSGKGKRNRCPKQQPRAFGPKSKEPAGGGVTRVGRETLTQRLSGNLGTKNPASAAPYAIYHQLRAQSMLAKILITIFYSCTKNYFSLLL